MDSSNRTSHDLALDELVALALNELERVGYGADSCRHYRTTWCRLVAFARDNGLGDRYSEELADRFVHGTGSRARERLGPSDKALRHAVLAIKVLGDFNRDRRIEPFLTDMLKVALPPTMKKPLRDYEEYCQEHRRLRPNTIAAHIRQVAKFLLFLDSRGVRRVQEMQPDVVTAFVVSRQHLRPRAVSWIVSSLRLFLKFLAMRGTLGEDLSRVLPRVLAVPDAAIPAVWDPELVVKLLTAVDRSSPRGKRDYAILLLAARLGLRTGDILTLVLDDIDWDAATLHIMQSKTGTPLRLPISEEVGEALIDYLRFARPKTEHRAVFLKLRAPFEPFAEGCHLSNVMVRWRRAAGIDLRHRRQQGFRSLRHTLATQLLRQETPST